MILQLMLVAFFGLIIGSFLNVCIYRVPRKESIVIPPSHCTNCYKKLRLRELIPILSYIVLKRRCSYCGCKIPIRYPLVEFSTSIIWTLLYLKYGFSFEFFAYAFLMSILITIFVIDIDNMIIPDILVIIASVGGLFVVIYNSILPMEIYGDIFWWNPILGGVLGSSFLFLVALLGMIIYKTDEAMGMGDVKLLFPIGIFLGWRMTIITLFIATIFAGITSMVLVIMGIINKKGKIAFGPFIVVATFITLMHGWKIFQWWIVSIY